MPRIVSLIASATEIVCALGLEDQLVGRSHECDYPESVQRLPICTAPKFDVNGTSLEIDQRVKALLHETTSVYRVDVELLRQLRPDLIVTQAQCDVCAVSLHDVEEALGQFLDTRPEVVALNPNALADVWNDMTAVATALGAAKRGAELVARLRERMELIARKAKRLPMRPTVACLEWLDPLMAAGNWMPELVDMAGGINLFGEVGKHSPWMSWEVLCERDPDVIVSLPCGLDLERTRNEMTALTRRPGWPELRAVKSGRVHATDGNQFFNRPGPRLVDSLEILGEILHPSVFHFQHAGRHWCQM